MQKWPSIEQLRNVAKHVRRSHDYQNNENGTAEPYPTLMFRGTPKLHGTNAGIRRENGEFIAQSRKNDLTVEKDNAGFAQFVRNCVREDEAALHELFDRVCSDRDITITIFGEWIGKGIQKIVAISELEKQFVVFGAYNHELEIYLDNRSSIQLHKFNIFNILEGESYLVGIDFNDPSEAVDTIEKLTLAIEERCPWAARFGVNGIGEGLVWQCLDNLSATGLWFKTKGEKHAGSGSKTKQKKVATISVEKLNTINEVVDYVLTPARLNQGLENVSEVDIKQMGEYLRWIAGDVMKEELDTIEENGLTWKEVAKYVQTRARKFFQDKCNEI